MKDNRLELLPRTGDLSPAQISCQPRKSFTKTFLCALDRTHITLSHLTCLSKQFAAAQFIGSERNPPRTIHSFQPGNDIERYP